MRRGYRTAARRAKILQNGYRKAARRAKILENGYRKAASRAEIFKILNKRMAAGHKSLNLYMRILPIGQINWQHGNRKDVRRDNILIDEQEITL